MYKRTIRSYAELARTLDLIADDKSKAEHDTLVYVASRIIPRHFDEANSLYKALTPKYALYKLKKYGNLPILSRTMVLRTLVRRNWKIIKMGSHWKIKWNLPRYAKYVRNERDFLAFTKKDRRNIQQQKRRIYRRLRSRRF
jgi:hypothetical protein